MQIQKKVFLYVIVQNFAHLHKKVYVVLKKLAVIKSYTRMKKVKNLRQKFVNTDKIIVIS